MAHKVIVRGLISTRRRLALRAAIERLDQDIRQVLVLVRQGLENPGYLVDLIEILPDGALH